MTPYGDRDLGQHWPREWLGAWRHQAITWTNIDWSSVKYSDIDIISKEMPQPSITKIRLKMTYLKFHSNFQGANPLNAFDLEVASFSDEPFDMQGMRNMMHDIALISSDTMIYE